MTEYVKNDRTGTVYEKVAEVDGWYWIRDSAGMMHSVYTHGFTAYDPVPQLGEVWTDDETGGEVVVVGEEDGQPVVIEVVDGTADVVHVAYRRDPRRLRKTLWPSPVKAEEVDADPVVKEVPAGPTTETGTRRPLPTDTPKRAGGV